MKKNCLDIANKDDDEFGNEIINSDFSKNAAINNMSNIVQSSKKNNLNDMDNRIHKINDKLNSLIKNSNMRTEDTKYNT